MRIGIDLMGSDHSPHVLLEGVLNAASVLPHAQFVVFATPNSLPKFKYKSIEFHPVPEFIEAQEEPLQALKKKKHSSIATGIALLKKKEIDGFVSAGNTGALLASATLQLPRFRGIKRPALLVCLPSLKGSVAVLDVGGNVSCTAQHLKQFALMGAAFQQCNEGIKKPNVGVLNIGVEPKKGTSVVREAYQLLHSAKSKEFKFVGNIEARDIFLGMTDVLVTDGFTGNVLLKTAEGLSGFIFDLLKKDSSSDHLRKLFSYTEYPGAFICGVEGVVVKCHGNSSPRALFSSLLGASKLLEQEIIPNISAKFD